MRVLLINPPYQTLTSNLGVGHQIPLGLLMIGGPLLDAGCDVRLLDAEAVRLSHRDIVGRVAELKPDIVMTGHAGSTPAHPICMEMLRAIRKRLAGTITVYGGVYPTYHAEAILRDEPAVDIVIRGEGEATALAVVQTIAEHPYRELDRALRTVEGVTFRDSIGRIVRNNDAPPILNLDDFRIGWELIDDWNRYQCFGLGRSAIVQFSRGCPHRCTYCGQHGFWKRWRHRDPVKLAEEAAWLHDVHGVKFITLADENPTTNRREWRQLLEALALRRERGCDVQWFATIRAADIVRDRDFVDLYRRAGILYVLMGIDATDPSIIERVRKRSTLSIDAQACALLHGAGVRSIIAHIVGLGEDSWTSFLQALQTLCRYDGDLLNVMYATPHGWTQFARESADRMVVQEDQRCWDYRHQVLHERHMPPWQLFIAVKLLEMLYHVRPRSLWRMIFAGDRRMRMQRWWTMLRIGAVWAGEIAEFILSTRFATRRRLKEWVGDRQATEIAATDSTATPLTVFRLGAAERQRQSAAAPEPADATHA